MEPATPDRPNRLLNLESVDEEPFWLPDEHHRRILEDPLIDTKVKIVAIAFAAAREGPSPASSFSCPITTLCIMR